MALVLGAIMVLALALVETPATTTALAPGAITVEELEVEPEDSLLLLLISNTVSKGVWSISLMSWCGVIHQLWSNLG
ncbi:hypothetical protein C8255_15570, partial [filamentous cyanobacterium CCP3]